MRLSDFKDEAAVVLISKLLLPISRIASNEKTAESKGNLAEFASAMMQNSPREVMEICALLDGKEPADYHTNAAEMLLSVLEMLNDPALMRLFGLQRQTPASSGSASAITEAHGTSGQSSDTAKPVQNENGKKNPAAST